MEIYIWMLSFLIIYMLHNLEEIEAHQQLFDAPDADAEFWTDVEEDSVLINEKIDTSNMTEVELEAVIFAEVE